MGTRRRAEAGPSPDTGADRTRVYSPAVSRVRVATPVAQSLKQRGGVRLEQQDLDPILAVSVPRPRKSSSQEQPAVDAAARLDSARIAVRKGACTRGYRTPVTAGLTPYPNPNAPPDADHTCTQASKDTGGCGEFESRRSSYLTVHTAGANDPR